MPKKSAFPDDRTLSVLSRLEVHQRKKLSVEDEAAIIRITAAVKSLSPFICMHVDEDGLHFQKRVTNGYARGLRRYHVRKRSLCFDNEV
jgi:hypothetical protein